MSRARPSQRANDPAGVVPPRRVDRGRARVGETQQGQAAHSRSANTTPAGGPKAGTTTVTVESEALSVSTGRVHKTREVYGRELVREWWELHVLGWSEWVCLSLAAARRERDRMPSTYDRAELRIVHVRRYRILREVR